MGSDRDKLLYGGRPWLGVNFWSRTGGPLMWRSYDPAVVREELATLAAHGINLTRSFCYWPDFHPEPDRLDEAVLARFADFLDGHTEAGLGTVPTFIVGHMSGQNWDPAWRQGRDLYGDVWMVARQAWFVRQLTERFAGHPAVAGWLLSNEMPLYGGPAPAEAVTAWAELLVQAVRAGGGAQPLSLGDGAWGIELSGVDNGFSLRATAPLIDFVGPHVYPMESDRVRLHLGPAFACELAGFAGKPVVLEEFGVSSDFSSAENAGHHYRQVLHTSLLAGASGWIAWNNTDYDHLAGQDPYRHHPFEMHFGLTDAAGAPKPQLAEVRAFAELLVAVDFPNCARPPSQAALVVPSHTERAYPFIEPEDRTFALASLRQAFVAAWEADLPARPMREQDGLQPGRALYLVPSAKQLTAPGWRDLERFADDGAVVYVSYSAGGHGTQRGPWHAGLDRMFGVEHQLTHGLVDPIEDEEVVGHRRGRRRRPARPPGPAGAPDRRRRPAGAVRLPAGAAGGRLGPGQPGADLARLRRAGRRRRPQPSGHGRGPTGPGGRAAPPRRAELRLAGQPVRHRGHRQANGPGPPGRPPHRAARRGGHPRRLRGPRPAAAAPDPGGTPVEEKGDFECETSSDC
ncbi:MAG: Mannan endo,4-beta-mannosidase [Actinomycetia bacterium]|nr:Mannan endo,4-beta-mannosidase [Actinomycetes bacterium]